MADDKTAASGQAPQSGGQAGQAPQANNGGSPSTAPNAGQAPDGNTSASSGQQLSAADYERIIADLRKENAGHRTGRADLEKQLKTFTDAQLTDAQKRERDVTDLQTRVFELEALSQTQGLQLAGYKLGAQLGIGDVSAALALVQVEHTAEIKYSASGEPENLQDLLKLVLKDHPALAGGQQVRQAASSGGATNPGTVARGGATFTREQIGRMSQREYAQNEAAIKEQLRQGLIRP